MSESKITFPAGGKGATAATPGTPNPGEKAHCYLGHDTANIRRIRYDMSVVLDVDESGVQVVASEDAVRGVIVKATSGLYSHKDPETGSCAKTLARHGETCANRPYIVPQSLIPNGQTTPAQTTPVQPNPNAKPETDAKYHAGRL